MPTLSRTIPTLTVLLLLSLTPLSLCQTKHPLADWQQQLNEELPLLGHRNWIAIVDSAYPLQTSEGIETIETNGDQLDIVRRVLHQLTEAPHLRPVVFTDEELKRLDKFVRDNTIERFGPVRSVRANKDFGLVLEIAFEGLQRSTRHKSGVAMRFPRINRIRWDKPAREADELPTLEKMLD